jgi:hypothetical protein
LLLFTRSTPAAGRRVKGSDAMLFTYASTVNIVLTRVVFVTALTAAGSEPA